METKNIKIACIFIGTMIGAGFASGREIALFFGNTHFLCPLISGVFCGVFCFVFLQLGRISSGNILAFSFKKISFVPLILVKLGNFVIFCAMLAACEFLIKNLLGINGGTVISTIIVLAFIYFGIEKLKWLNTIIVPMIVVLLLIMFFSNNAKSLNYEKFVLFSPLLYATMNILSGGYLISTFAKNLSSKDCFIISIICSIILSALLLIIHIIIKSYTYAPMPLLLAAKTMQIEKIGCIVIYLAVFSTLSNSLYIISKENIKYAILVASIGLIVACLGFEKIVNNFYPFVGYFGIMLTAVVSIKLFFYKFYKRKLFLS